MRAWGTETKLNQCRDKKGDSMSRLWFVVWFVLLVENAVRCLAQAPDTPCRSSLFEKGVDLFGGQSAFVNGMDYKGLAFAAVAGSKDFLIRSTEVFELSLVVGALVQVQLKRLADIVLRTKKAHGEQDQIRWPEFHLSLIHI